MRNAETIRSLAGLLVLLLVTGAATGATATIPAATTVTEPAPGVPVKRHQAPRVPWIEDRTWAAIVENAKTDDQPILIDFYAVWCGPCRLLDAMVYNEKAVIKELADVVTFKVDVDKPEYLELKRKFAIERLPTLVWCDQNGREIDRFIGYRSRTEFLDIVSNWRTDRTIDRVLADRKAASPEDPVVLLDLARRHQERGQIREAEIQYRRLMNLRERADLRTVSGGMLGMAALAAEAGRRDEARDLTRRAVALFTGDLAAEMSEQRTEAMMEVALFQESLGDSLDALETYRTMVGLDDRDVVALDAFARGALAANRHLEEATRCALRAMVFSDRDPGITATLAESYYRRHFYGKAVRWMEHAVAGNPDQKHFRDRLAVYQLALDDHPR